MQELNLQDKRLIRCCIMIEIKELEKQNAKLELSAESNAMEQIENNELVMARLKRIIEKLEV